MPGYAGCKDAMVVGKRAQDVLNTEIQGLSPASFSFFFFLNFLFYSGVFPGGSDSKASACNAGDLGSVPGSGRSPGEGNGNPLQYSCLKNPMD